MFHMFSTYDAGSIAQMPIHAFTQARAVEIAREWLAQYDHGFSHAIVVNDAQAMAWMFLSANVIHAKVTDFIARGFIVDLIVHLSDEEMALEFPHLIPANWVGDSAREGSPIFEACEEQTCFNCCDYR